MKKNLDAEELFRAGVRARDAGIHFTQGHDTEELQSGGWMESESRVRDSM
jgi:hypothetical protein